MRKLLLPLVVVLFAVLSLTTLRSIMPELVAKQTIAFGLGAVVFTVAAAIPWQWHLRFAPWLYLALNVSLLGLLIYGSVTRGISAWITLPFGFKFQPSQFALPITAVYLASFFRQETKFSWVLLWQALVIMAVPTLLILLEPDFGTALVLAAGLGMFLFFNRLSLSQILNLVAIAAVVVLLLWTVVFKEYQRNRLLGFLHLHQTSSAAFTSQESSSAYNARQALIAVGSGQVWGRGIGQGVQSHLRFLPERQTDFMFASFAEEWGLIGALFLLFLYAALLYFLWYALLLLPNFQEQLYVGSLLAMFLVQIFVNVGMNMAIVPITGITLPFMSYGGSSIIALLYALGIVQSSIRRLNRQANRSFY
jgi:rod shape determining protein RodA